ncbi:DNA replication/repair protein RecF [Hyphomicrobium sulfonivorans]|uniref:DNA replication and repair protein RecF n=1 Tax=Hyphomicrobium sulfonivorans TaxID=121290 RepID=A0A109BLD4_HYPSL|nr:DNA replication/repair protein RecF [Hyphomicrobium sulfonivorans]KWT70923.1 DNA recombination and repair protein RecF [Hyphomicrobium sulfonivorans]MBI1648300.1 DNA replication/repair protein RecF [Hyphomicrobium sulfonivorans]NSL71165.1 DNA replication and repair protein RecF [Hyphomicrobium sulfonivorans]
MSAEKLWVERLTLSNFRNYAHATIEAGPEPQVLIGANGAGKTNLLEAISLLTPGQGMRRVSYPDLARGSGDGGWAVAAHTHTHVGAVDIGTGLLAENAVSERAGRIVRINGENAGAGALADLVEVMWVTPAMDGLFTGAGSERRRFLDRLILCFDPHYRTGASRFERAMQQRNRLLADGVRDPSRFEGLELLMAETGVAIAAARAEAVTGLAAIMAERAVRDPSSPFPPASLALEGALEADLERMAAVEVEDVYMQRLRAGRERDRAAGRTLDGPHRSDLIVSHAPKSMPARLCSTGEQKALLIGLVLAHAELVARRRDAAPILLLDEVTAHLDADRRAALFAEILRLGVQAWMTGTDEQAFSWLTDRARFRRVSDGVLETFAPRYEQGAASPSN